MQDTDTDTGESIQARVVAPLSPAGFARYAPTPEEVGEMQKYFIDRRDELVREVNEIEAMLGFVVQSTDLATRVAKIEQFLGIKG